MVHNKIVPVILSGGVGKRLWPLSTQTRPKQFCSLFPGQDNLFLQTLKRVKNPSLFQDALIVSNNHYKTILEKELKSAVDKSTIIYEPYMKNTLPAIILAALVAYQKSEDATLLVLPSDHHINQFKYIKNSIKLALPYLNDHIILYGVHPTYPSTEYGYIHYETVDNKKIHNVKNFVEKPSKEKAQAYIQENYAWNCGIFLLKAGVLLREASLYEPEILESCKSVLGKNNTLNRKLFKNCPAQSIDYGILQKTKNLKMILLPSDVGWYDLGSWASLKKASLAKRSNEGNVLIGKIKDHHVSNCYIRASTVEIVASNVRNLIIVETDGKLFITSEE